MFESVDSGHTHPRWLNPILYAHLVNKKSANILVFFFIFKIFTLQEMCCGFLLSREMWYRKSVLPGTGAG